MASTKALTYCYQPVHTTMQRTAKQWYDSQQQQQAVLSTQSYLLLLATSNNAAALALHEYNRPLFDSHRKIVAAVLLEAATDVPEFFASNYVASLSVLQQPAAAAWGGGGRRTPLFIFCYCLCFDTKKLFAPWNFLIRCMRFLLIQFIKNNVLISIYSIPAILQR